MTLEAQMYKEGKSLDHTAAAAITGGDVQNLGGLAAVPPNDIAASADDALAIAGIVKAAHTASVGKVGQPVWWDEDGDPYGGTAGTGAATTVASAGDFFMGCLAADTTATSAYCYVLLNAESPQWPAWANKPHETKSANYTVDALDSGKVIHVDTDAKTITLPSTIAGLDVIFVNDGDDAGVLLTLAVAAADKIMGPDVAGTDTKGQLNTKLTAKRGDFLHLVGDGADGWFIVEKRGTWAEEA